MLRLLNFVALLSCGAVAAQSPTVSPIPQPPFPGFEECSICGEGNTVSYLHRALVFPGFPELTCQALQEAGLDGFIDPAFCVGMRGMIEGPCRCVPGSPISATPYPTPPPSMKPTPFPIQAPIVPGTPTFAPNTPMPVIEPTTPMPVITVTSPSPINDSSTVRQTGLLALGLATLTCVSMILS